MKKWIPLILILGVLFFSFGKKDFKNTPPQDKIKWNKNKPLRWSDFEGSSRYKNPQIAALTTSVITYTYNCNNGQLQFLATAEFIKPESWVRSSAKDNYTLQHEQKHFDITEIYARKLNMRVKNENFRCNEINQLERIIKEYLSEWENKEWEYDYATRFSLNKSAQKKWDAYIDDLLEELPSF